MSEWETHQNRFQAVYNFPPDFRMDAGGRAWQFERAREVHDHCLIIALRVVRGETNEVQLKQAIAIAVICQAIPRSWNGQFDKVVDQLVRHYLEGAADAVQVVPFL